MMRNVDEGTTILLSEPEYMVFSFGDTVLRFLAPYSLRRYMRVKAWHNGCLTIESLMPACG